MIFQMILRVSQKIRIFVKKYVVNSLYHKNFISVYVYTDIFWLSYTYFEKTYQFHMYIVPEGSWPVPVYKNF